MNVLLFFLPILIQFTESKICEVCQNLVNEFHVGLKDSDKGNFGGGNTAWEEERLGSYATSETRLIHILDSLCPSSVKNIDRCHYFREESEEHIEKWWFNIYRKEYNADSLYDYLCINHMNACCPANHYGKICAPCNHYDVSKELLCSGHGTCFGNGTREGNGTCLCDLGYRGDKCDVCDPGYFNTSNGICEKCHQACVDCNGAASDQCITCNNGYEMINSICEDINECLNKTLCIPGQFCSNIPGSYECIPCSESCRECSGKGTDNCVSCNDGFQIIDSICEDINECDGNGDLCNQNGQMCRNTYGSFTCDCIDNYEKQVDGSCTPIDLPNESRDNSEL